MKNSEFPTVEWIQPPSLKRREEGKDPLVAPPPPPSVVIVVFGFDKFGSSVGVKEQVEG